MTSKGLCEKPEEWSSDHEEEGDSDEKLTFAVTLRDFKILLTKGKSGDVREEKKSAMQELLQQLANNGMLMTEKQVANLIKNMKARTKQRLDLKQTGNKPIRMLPWMKIFQELLEVENNPTFSKLPGATGAGFEEPDRSPAARPPPPFMRPSTSSAGTSASAASIPCSSGAPRGRSTQRHGLPETDETKRLSNAELQRLVLLGALENQRKERELLELKLHAWRERSRTPSSRSSLAASVADFTSGVPSPEAPMAAFVRNYDPDIDDLDYLASMYS